MWSRDLTVSHLISCKRKVALSILQWRGFGLANMKKLILRIVGPGFVTTWLSLPWLLLRVIPQRLQLSQMLWPLMGKRFSF